MDRKDTEREKGGEGGACESERGRERGGGASHVSISHHSSERGSQLPQQSVTTACSWLQVWSDAVVSNGGPCL